MHRITYEGIDATEYRRVVEAGVDHGGNQVEPFIDTDGGMPMRCCLADSAPGDSVAIVAWNPFPWSGAYAETGPIFIHARGCPGWSVSNELPVEFERRPLTLRPYGPGRTIEYALVRHVDPGDDLGHAIGELVADHRVDFVHARNRTGGCFAFTARIGGSRDAPAGRPV